MMNKSLDLADYGWSPHFQSQLDLSDLETTTPARVLAVHRGMLEVAGPTFSGRINTGMLDDRDDEERVTVGDWLRLVASPIAATKANLDVPSSKQWSKVIWIQTGSNAIGSWWPKMPRTKQASPSVEHAIVPSTRWSNES